MHALAEATDSSEARRLLAEVLHAAFYLSKDLGHGDLAWIVRTGDGTVAGLNFGPRNVGVWRVALTLELGEPGRVVELAREVDVAAIPSAGRQAAFYGDVGRGLATIRGREEQAVEALRRADMLAPQLIRTNPFIRETVSDLLRRARPGSLSREVRGMAYRRGLGTRTGDLASLALSHDRDVDRFPDIRVARLG